MSGANPWLRAQRKGDLTELAEHTGLKNYGTLRKTDLELALDEYLSENSTQFNGDPKLAPYFSSRARTIGSPIKKEPEAPSEKLRVSRRRTIKAPEDFTPSEPAEEGATGTSTALVQTPGRALSLASRIPLPATPADVAEAVDRSTMVVRTRVASLYKKSGISETSDVTRETLSTVTSVLYLVSIFELFFLRSEVLPDRYAFTIPAIGFLRTKDYPVQIPDLFLLVTSSFWSPVLLWAFTSSLLPTLVGYFINLTVAHPAGRRTRSSSPTPEYNVDPLTFSIVKALISFVVYGQKVTFGGWIDETSITRIDGAIYGGWKGILVGTAVTGLVSMYDAVLRK